MGERESWIRCFGDDRHHTVIEGIFADRKNGGSSRLFLSNRGEEGCYLDHEEGQGQVMEVDSARLVTTCRDPITGYDQAVIRTQAGAYADVRVWGIDPSTSGPRQLYKVG